MKQGLLLGALFFFSFISFGQDKKTADSLFQLKEYERAYTLYSAIVQIKKAYVEVYRRLGYCLYISDNMRKDAETYFKSALELDSSDLASNYLYAKCLLENDQFYPKSYQPGRRKLAQKHLRIVAKSNYEDSKLLLTTKFNN